MIRDECLGLYIAQRNGANYFVILHYLSHVEFLCTCAMVRHLYRGDELITVVDQLDGLVILSIGEVFAGEW